MPEWRRAAVLVPLCGPANETEVVLTQRAVDLPTHAGEIAFPGGRHDPERDDSLLATALREADEEIGLRPSDVQVLGALPTISTLSTRFEIHPFVGRIPSNYPFAPHPGEVFEVFRMPLRAHGDAALRVAHRWTVSDRTIEAPGILFDGHLVWGATLRILDLLQQSRFRPE